MNTSRSLKLYWPLIIALIIGSLALAVYLFYPTPRLLTAQPTDEVELNKLTWLEVRSLLQTGKSSIIIPTAGIEQNGRHIILGKHGFIVREAALAIAKELGNALVAPTIETVPEGNIDPPTGHMQYSGTVSIPEEVFEQILEHTARSFKHHGFKTQDYGFLPGNRVQPGDRQKGRILRLAGKTRGLFCDFCFLPKGAPPP